MFTIPNLLTSCNLLFGCLALVSLNKSNIDWCIYFIILAGVADFLDGFVAKRMNQNTELGVQLDSLSDVVSFGLLPGMMAYAMMEQMQLPMPSLAFFGFLLTLMAAFRLARFNVNVKQGNHYFKGLPVPASGLFFAGMLSLFQREEIRSSWLFHPFIFLSLILAISILMVSNVKMIKYFFYKRWMKMNGFILVIEGVSMLSAIWIGAGALSVVVLLHILISILIPLKHFQINTT